MIHFEFPRRSGPNKMFLKPCERLMHGDLKERFENEVLHNPNEEERGGMMSVMNIQCGHVELECTYTLYRLDHDECQEKCQDQSWHEGFDHYVDPCDFILESFPENLNDDHWDDDHWDDNDHWDGHSKEDLWGMIMDDNRVCFVFDSCYNPKFQILVPRS